MIERTREDVQEALCRRVVRILGDGRRRTAQALKQEVERMSSDVVGYIDFCDVLTMLESAGFVEQIKPIGGGTIRELTWQGIGMPADSKE